MTSSLSSQNDTATWENDKRCNEVVIHVFSLELFGRSEWVSE